jgi:MOSC domain-containing protein YiiM
MTARAKLVSVNVGRPAPLEWRGRVITTSFLKRPVEGPVIVHGVNIEGDQQSDLEVHGGPQKSVYVYPAEHYPFWRGELPGVDLPFGSFGENLNTLGVTEESVHPGDRLRIGDADLIVTRPRFPCIKMAFRFQREDILRRFQLSGRSGFYVGIAREGTIRSGDEIELVRSDSAQPSIAEIFRRDPRIADAADQPAVGATR